MNVLKVLAGQNPVKNLSPEELREALERAEYVSAELQHALLTQHLLAHKYGIK